MGQVSGRVNPPKQVRDAAAATATPAELPKVTPDEMSRGMRYAMYTAAGAGGGFGSALALDITSPAGQGPNPFGAAIVGAGLGAAAAFGRPYIAEAWNRAKQAGQGLPAAKVVENPAPAAAAATGTTKVIPQPTKAAKPAGGKQTPANGGMPYYSSKEEALQNGVPVGNAKGKSKPQPTEPPVQAAANKTSDPAVTPGTSDQAQSATVEEAAKVAQQRVSEAPDFSKMTRNQLYSWAKERGIEMPKSAKGMKVAEMRGWASSEHERLAAAAAPAPSAETLQTPIASMNPQQLRDYAAQKNITFPDTIKNLTQAKQFVTDYEAGNSPQQTVLAQNQAAQMLNNLNGVGNEAGPPTEAELRGAQQAQANDVVIVSDPNDINTGEDRRIKRTGRPVR